MYPQVTEPKEETKQTVYCSKFTGKRKEPAFKVKEDITPTEDLNYDMIAYNKKMVFGREYRPDKEQDFSTEFIKDLEKKLEPVRNELENNINQLINNCKLELNLQQIELRDRDLEKEVVFFVDLDLVRH
jgi:hypothetical protein